MLAGAALVATISQAWDISPEVEQYTQDYKSSVDMHVWNNLTTTQAIEALQSYNGPLNISSLERKLIVLDSHGLQGDYEKTLAYQNALIKIVEYLNNGTINTHNELQSSIEYASYKMSYHRDTQEEYI